MNTATELTSTVSALGREVPIWAFLVVAVLLVLGGVTSIVVRRAREASGEQEHSTLTPLPSTAAVLFFAAAVVFLPVFAVLVQAF